MKRDPLRTMLRIRQSALDEAQTAVAAAYAAERGALSRVEEATAALAREMGEAMNLAAGDEAVESFARWLPVGRGILKRAHDGQRDATATLDRTRAVLALARSGVRAVESLMEQRQREQALEEGRREQRVLDEAGGRRSVG